MIPDSLKRWATTNVLDHYYPYQQFLVALSKEIDELIEEMHSLLLEEAEKESDRRLELLRRFYRRRESLREDLPIFKPNLKDWK